MTSNKKRIRLSEIIGPAFYETHKLIDMGFNQKQAVAILYAISATLGLTAVVLTSSGEVKAVVLLAAVLAAILVGACIIYGAEHWGKHPQEQKKHKNEAG